MSKTTSNKGHSIFKKIGIGFGATAALAIFAASIYWISLPKEARNMISFMAFSKDTYDDPKEYQVIERNKEGLQPSGIDINAVEESAQTNNIYVGTATEMVKNNTSSMLKRGTVETLGGSSAGWHVLADEGAKTGTNPYGPSPLSYYTAGIASSLHTQIITAAKQQGVILDNVSVEVLNNFRWNDMMSATGTGHLDLSTVNIIINSEASNDVIQSIKEQAIATWSVGEALRNKTTVVPHLEINGNDWDIYNASPGTAKSDVSYDGNIKLSSITQVPKTPEYLKLTTEENGMSIFDMSAMSNMSFQIYAISQSARNSDRPYLKKVTISTPTKETWEIYSDEFMGANDTPVAPTSLEYFAIGTSLCLTSQTTLVSAMMGLDYSDYRVEHLFEFTQANVNTSKASDSLDTIQTYVFIESNESKETLEAFFNKSLALCFAGDGLANETEMDINVFLNGNKQN